MIYSYRVNMRFLLYCFLREKASSGTICRTSVLNVLVWCILTMKTTVCVQNYIVFYIEACCVCDKKCDVLHVSWVILKTDLAWFMYINFNLITVNSCKNINSGNYIFLIDFFILKQTIWISPLMFKISR